MRLGVTIASSVLAEVSEQAAVAAKLGAKGINIYPSQIRAHGRAVEDAVRVMKGMNTLVAQVACWSFNPLRPDPEALEEVKLAIEFAGKYGGACTVVFGAGGLNSVNPWIGHPDNWTERARRLAAEAIKPLAGLAEQAGTRIALEPQFANVCSNAEATLDLLAKVGSDAVGVSMDVVNYCTYQDFWDTKALIDRVVEPLAGRCFAVHLKDLSMEPRLVIHMNECPAGQGVMEYPYLLARLDKVVRPDDWAVVEHTPVEELAKTFSFVRESAVKANIRFL